MTSTILHFENRLIAMLDVLGLSIQIQDKSALPNVIDNYKQLIMEARKIQSSSTIPGSKEPEDLGFEIGEFVFDTVVIVSYPVDVKNTCNFIRSIVQLMEKFAKAQMPLRGAIGVGDYCANTEVNVFLSDVFKRLDNEEKRQNWTGCVLLPEVEDQVLSDLVGFAPDNPKQSDILHKYSVPFKENEVENRWCLNWSYLLTARETDSLLEYMQGDCAKHVNTLAYIKHIESLPDDAQRLPPEFFPAIKLKAIKTRSSMRICFEDEHGEPTEPGCKSWTIGVTE